MRICPNSSTLRWHTHTHHTLHKDPNGGMWKHVFWLQFSFTHNAWLEPYSINHGSQPKIKSETSRYTHKRMAENDGPVSTFWYTKMAYKQFEKNTFQTNCSNRATKRGLEQCFSPG